MYWSTSISTASFSVFSAFAGIVKVREKVRLVGTPNIVWLKVASRQYCPLKSALRLFPVLGIDLHRRKMLAL